MSSPRLLPASRGGDAFAAVARAPLLVNVLRLLRNGRSANYADHERGPVPFVFGGLHMRDTGAYADAERAWRRAAADDGVATATRAASRYGGPLELLVCIDGVVVERWTVEDYRDGRTDHSVVRSLEQVEQLNGLVRVLYAYLRTRDLYAEIVQCCTQSVVGGSADAAAATTTEAASESGDDDDGGALAAAATGLTLRVRVGSVARASPPSPPPSSRVEMWAVDDLLRVTVARNALWRARVRRSACALLAPPPSPSRQVEHVQTTTTTTAKSNNDAGEARERSAPVPCVPRVGAFAAAARSPSTPGSTPRLAGGAATATLAATSAASAGGGGGSSCGSNSVSSLIARVGSNSSAGRSIAPTPHIAPSASSTLTLSHRAAAMMTTTTASPPLFAQTPTQGVVPPLLMLPPSELPLLSASFAHSTATKGGGGASARAQTTATTSLPPHVLRMRHVFARAAAAATSSSDDDDDDAVLDRDDDDDDVTAFALGSMAIDEPLPPFASARRQMTRRQRRRRGALDLLALCRDASSRRARGSVAEFGELVQGFVFDNNSGTATASGGAMAC